MLVGAGDDVDRAAGERLQRLRAAAKVVDGDVESLLLEVTEPFGDGQRQVIKRGFAADGERHLLLFRSLSLGGTGKRERQGQRAKALHAKPPACAIHGLLPAATQ